MVSVCLPSDALLQHLPSYLSFSYLGHGVSLHGCSSKLQSLLLTLDKGYLLNAPFLPSTWDSSSRPSCAHASTTSWTWGCSSWQPPWPRTQGSSSRPFLCHHSLALSATAPDLRRGVTPLGRCPDLGRRVAPLGRSCAIAAWHSRPLPLTSDVG